MGPGLDLELLRAVLADDRHPGLGEHAHLLGRDVLDRREDLDPLADLVPHAGEIVGHAMYATYAEDSAEVAFAIARPYQGMGVGTLAAE